MSVISLYGFEWEFEMSCEFVSHDVLMFVFVLSTFLFVHDLDRGLKCHVAKTGTAGFCHMGFLCL